jgi:hypothetical protein
MDGRSGSGGALLRARTLRATLLAGAALAALALFPAASPARTAAPCITTRTVLVATAAHPARAVPQVVLSQGHGLLLTGRPTALRTKPAPALDSLSEDEAGALGALPGRNVFLRGADCDWGAGASRFGSPVTLTFSLPKALFRLSSLPMFRYDGHTWRRLSVRAVVGEVNTTASATITRPGRYVLLLTTDWEVVSEDGEDLVEYTGATAPTVIKDPAVKATGTTSDPAIVAATMEVSGSTQEQAASTLRSFDSRTTPVQVVTLRTPAAMERYWSGTSSVGRWFSPSGGPVLSPADARRVYSLPASNTGLNVTLHLVRPGVALIMGLCAGMTDVSGYGPWATGGGQQYFGPYVSTYPPPLYDPAAITTLADLRWEKDVVDAVVW